MDMVKAVFSKTTSFQTQNIADTALNICFAYRHYVYVNLVDRWKVMLTCGESCHLQWLNFDIVYLIYI